MMFKLVNGLAPPYLTEMFTSNITLNNYGLRSSNYDLEFPKCRTNCYKNSFAFNGVKVWNALKTKSYALTNREITYSTPLGVHGRRNVLLNMAVWQQ